MLYVAFCTKAHHQTFEKGPWEFVPHVNVLLMVVRTFKIYKNLHVKNYTAPMDVDTATSRAPVCRWTDVTIPHSLSQRIVISLWLASLKRYPAKRSLIVCHICVNRRLKTRSVNGGVFLRHNLKCLVSVRGRRQNTENECSEKVVQQHQYQQTDIVI